MVKVQHDGFQSVYAHLASVYVKRNWVIMRGQKIGGVGPSGHATGPHLHFEIRNRRGYAQNPLKYFREDSYRVATN